MAVWQYKVALVPRKGILLHHGRIPEELPDYRGVWDPEIGTDDAFLNYWAGGEPPEFLAVELGCIMPPCESWSEDALMFGIKHADTVTIWLGESLYLRLDLRKLDLDLVRAVVTFADSHDLLWVSDTLGRPIRPEFQTVLQDMQASAAYHFCKDPEGFLKTLLKEARVSGVAVARDGGDADTTSDNVT